MWAPRIPGRQVELLIANLAKVTKALAAGSVVVSVVLTDVGALEEGVDDADGSLLVAAREGVASPRSSAKLRLDRGPKLRFEVASTDGDDLRPATFPIVRPRIEFHEDRGVAREMRAQSSVELPLASRYDDEVCMCYDSAE